MIARLKMTEQGRGDRGHAARRAARRRSAFERAHARLEHGDRGVGVAAIDEAFLVALESGFGLLGAVIDVAGIEEDGLGGLAELTPERAAMDKRGGLVPGNGLAATVLARAHVNTPYNAGRAIAAQKNPDSGFRQKTGIGLNAPRTAF